MYFYPILLSSIALLVLVRDGSASANSDDESDQYRVLIGDWITQAMTCKNEIEDAGVELKLLPCLALYEGNKNIDSTSKEYDNCKALVACVMKKSGVMSSDGSSLIKDKVMEISDIFEHKYKGIKDEVINVIWPGCEKSTGKNEGQLAFNFMECVFKKSQMAKKLKDKFFSFFHGVQEEI